MLPGITNGRYHAKRMILMLILNDLSHCMTFHQTGLENAIVFSN